MSKIIGHDSLSDDMISNVIDKFCYNINKLKTTVQIGRGAQGVVHEWCLNSNNCNFVMKISEIYYPPNRLNKLFAGWKKEQEISNILSQYNLAPKIYAMRYCPKDEMLLTLMDKIKGNTVRYYLNYNKFNNSDMRLLIEYIDKIHALGLYHGDLNPANIFYDESNKKFQFIDITYRKMWRPYYDYLTIMYYFPPFFKKHKDTNLILGFLQDLIDAVDKEINTLDIVSDECVDSIRTIILRMGLIPNNYTDRLENYSKMLEEISDLVVNKIYYRSHKRCKVITK